MISERENQIRQFVDEELNHYPEARLVDVYKNYFQDAYGSGHLIADTAMAGAYLDEEIRNATWKDTTLWQALGIYHDYYRINLSLVRDGIIPRNVMLQAMVKSATIARKPDIETWKTDWKNVLKTIKETYPNLPGLVDDEKLIEETLSKGNVVMHHSKTYEETYHPHYRIIHRSVFERWNNTYLKIKPLKTK